MRPARTAAGLAVATALALGPTACTITSAGPDRQARTEPAATAAEEGADAAEVGDAEEVDAPAAEDTEGALPDWANPVTTPGEQISTYAVGDLRVDVYQVGVVQATREGLLADPDTHEPLIAVGDDLVFVNYVVTNTGAPLDLGFSLVSIDERYVDWPYLGGMDTILDDDLYAAQGVNADAMHDQAYRDPGVFTLGTGQSFSFGTNFLYRPGTDITFRTDVTPVDARGDLLHDERLEAEGTGTVS